MTGPLAALLARIEAAAGLDPATLSASSLSAEVAERQDLLNAAQRLDVSRLTPAERTSLRLHLQALQTNCTALTAAVRARMEQLGQSRVQLVSARGAMRGYRPLMKRKSRAVDRSV